MAVNDGGKPLPYVELYVIAAVVMVRIEPTAEASSAAMRERSKLGIAMAAMIKIIATTINSSIREKPFCRLFIKFEFHLEYPKITGNGRSKRAMGITL